MVKKTPEEWHTYLATSYEQLARIYMKQGRYQEAEPVYQMALEMFAMELGNQCEIVDCYSDLGWICTMSNRLAEGEELLITAMEIALSQLSERQDIIEDLEEQLRFNHSQQENTEWETQR